MFSLLPLVAPHLKAGAWPQDNLQRLKSLAGVPIDARNREVISRDYFGVTGNTGFIMPGNTVQRTVTPGQDGDFWMNSMGFWAIPDESGDFNVPMPSGTVQITDNSSGYNLFNPSVRIAFLCGVIPLQADPLVGNTTANTMLQRPYCRVTLPQPYPLLRDSSFTVSVTLGQFSTVNSHNVYFVLDGWKEFQYAAT